jgi:hypothetical protein
MALFLTILEGETPEKARPLIATRDPELIRLVTDELARRLEPSYRKKAERETHQMARTSTHRRNEHI